MQLFINEVYLLISLGPHLRTLFRIRWTYIYSEITQLSIYQQHWQHILEQFEVISLKSPLRKDDSPNQHDMHYATKFNLLYHFKALIQEGSMIIRGDWA